jgi:hypothetical protein
MARRAQAKVARDRRRSARLSIRRSVEIETRRDPERIWKAIRDRKALTGSSPRA